MQPRTRAGIDFELSLQSDLWVKNEQKPKMVWDVIGRNVFAFHNNKDLAFEVKRYEKSKLNKWTLYSEPFFKVATREEMIKIDTQTYNKFVSDFYTKRKDIINKVLENISKNTLGIRVIDEFIPQHKIEYRAEILKGWGGYDRITIQFKIKG
jgi:hypothetical protein